MLKNRLMGLKFYIILVLGVVFIVAIAGCLFFYGLYQGEKDKRQFVEDFYKNDGTVAATYNKKLFKIYLDSMMGLERLRNAGIKPSSVTEATHSTVNTTNILNVALKDSITMHHDTLRCINYNDGYTKVYGCWGKGQYPVSTRADTIDIIRYRDVVKRFLFIPTKKEMKDTLLNRDPKSHYTLRSIKYVKNRKSKKKNNF